MRQWNHLVAQAYVEPFVILTILILNAVIAIWQVLSLGVLWWKGVSEVSEPVTICLIRYDAVWLYVWACTRLDTGSYFTPFLFEQTHPQF